MGNNNATASLTEAESSKVETNEKSVLDSVSVETTQDHVFLASEVKDGDKEKESLPDGVTGKETPETESQSLELVEDSIVKEVEEEMHQSDLESLVMETDEQLQKQTSTVEGSETLCDATKVEELSMIGTQSVVSILNTTEPGNEEKPYVNDEIVFVSPSFYENAETEEKMVNESLEEISTAEEVVELDQEISMEQIIVSSEIEPPEILNLDYRVVDEEEVTNEGNADKAISKPGLQETNTIQETGFGVYKEEKDMELGREASLKRMSRCRSLPVSQCSRVIGDSLVQQLVSAVAFPSRNKIGLEKANTSETPLLSCVGSSKEARLEMRSPTFGNDLRIEEKIDESTEKTPLLSEDKTQTCEATIPVEESIVMLNRSETEKTRGIELSLGLSMTPSRQSEAYDSFKETKGSGDNLLDEKANTSETLLVSCVGRNQTQVTIEAITESNKEAVLEMQSPSFGNDLRIEERSNESTEKSLLLCQDKAEIYEATINVEKKTVMLKRSESERSRGFELSLGLSMKPGERSEAEDRLKGTKGSRENLLDKKASLGSMKGRVRKRSKSLLLGTCLCCDTSMN
ncbi:hypothetical protein AALP_AAs70636U001400 [Arabis alpina]|uniref:Uncharacterized protein n=1 Tax=Arabis alpina TaxID=50452 RepID=A0A087G1B3_ARAAL|nr:hypothetical protein AALP_AAs70636U001400 [Arabis alpina]